jgi:transcriptional regulator with XRE-family HTH domain
MLRIKLAERTYCRGWTLKTIAELMEVDYQTVLLWNKGKAMPRMQTLLRLSQLLGCTMEQLIES